MIYLLAFFLASLISLQAILISVVFSDEFFFINNVILVFIRNIERKNFLFIYKFQLFLKSQNFSNFSYFIQKITY